eukprot:scaffold31397_cov41-Phaeocystis_antarctica.AAC.3
MELVVVKGIRRKQRAGGGSGRRLRAQGRRGAHPEHPVHVRDARGFPVGNVCIEVLQVVEEPAHVGDGRDVPIGDEAVRRFGGGHVGVVRLDRRLQRGLGRKDVTEQAAVVGGWHPLANGGGTGAEDSGGAEEDEDAEIHSTQRRLVDGEMGIQWAPHAG